MLNSIFIWRNTMSAEVQEVGKKFWLSKTLWVNVVAGLAIIVQASYGFVVSPEYQALALSLINLGLRKITNEPLVW